MKCAAAAFMASVIARNALASSLIGRHRIMSLMVRSLGRPKRLELRLRVQNADVIHLHHVMPPPERSQNIGAASTAPGAKRADTHNLCAAVPTATTRRLRCYPAVILDRPDLRKLNTEIGRRLRYRRILMAMSLREVGAAIGVSFQQIQKYEQGDCSISAKRLWQLAGALRVSINDQCPAVDAETTPA